MRTSLNWQKKWNENKVALIFCFIKKRNRAQPGFELVTSWSAVKCSTTELWTLRSKQFPMQPIGRQRTVITLILWCRLINNVICFNVTPPPDLPKKNDAPRSVLPRKQLLWAYHGPALPKHMPLLSLQFANGNRRMEHRVLNLIYWWSSQIESTSEYKRCITASN